MVDYQDGDRILLGYQWDHFKHRFGVVSFTDDVGIPVNEGALTDHDKQGILARYTGHDDGGMLTDVMAEQRPEPRRVNRLQGVFRRFGTRRRVQNSPVWDDRWYPDRGFGSFGD